MNRITLAAVSTALITSSTAFAQDDITINQDGLDHSVTIEQVEDPLNSITVTQGGSLQSATISQRAPGTGNTAFTLQGDIGGLGSNALTIRQLGSGNLVAVGQNSSANIAQVTQNGDANEAFVDQGFVDGSGFDGIGNSTFALQVGSSNTVTIDQNRILAGGGNDADVFQYSDDNIATVSQEGLNNVAFIIQGDFGGAGMNTATATQEGSGNLMAIAQDGSLNQAIGFQQGNNNSLFIDQGANNGTGTGGDGNYAEGRQIGNDNLLTINQNLTSAGGNNSAIITQRGDGLELTIDQEGNGDVIELTQVS